MSKQTSSSIDDILAETIQVSRIGRATDPKPKDKVWFTTQMQDLFVLDFTHATQAIKSLIQREVVRVCEKVIGEDVEPDHTKLADDGTYQFCETCESLLDDNQYCKCTVGNALRAEQRKLLEASLKEGE